MGLISRLKLYKNQHPLSFRLLFFVILCSSFFTLLATVSQLYFDYKRDLKAIHTNLKFIEDSYIPSISTSLYYVDDVQLRIQLKGAIKLADIEYVQIKEQKDNEEFMIFEGDPDTTRDIVKTFPLRFHKPSGEIISVGFLTAAASLEGVYNRLWNKVLVILVTNAIKTLVAAIFIFLIIQFLITRHLTKMASFAQQIHLNKLDSKLELNRKASKSSKPDELEQVTLAINDMQTRLRNDIQKREQLVEELRLQSEIIANLAEGVYLGRADDGVIIFTNPAFERMFGYDSGEIIGKHISILSAPSDKSPEETAQEIIGILDKTGTWQGEINNIKKDGTPFWCYAHVSMFDHPVYGKVWVTVHTDITERKRAEEALRESEGKYRTLVESTTDPIYVVDEDCNYMLMNEKYLSRHGLTKDEIKGKTYGEFHSKEETKDFAKKIKEVFETGKSLSYEYRSQSDGRYFFRTLSHAKELDGKIASVTVISKDITDLKQAEAALRFSNEDLQKAHNQRKILSKRLIDRLEKDRQQIAMELHDHIGQTLISLKMSLEIAHEKLTPGQTEVEDHITTAKERTLQVLKDVKKISLGLRPSTIDTLGLVPSLRELFNEIQKQTDIEINFFSRMIPKQIEKKKKLAIYRIAQEALTNIVKHAQSKKVFANLTRKDNKLLLSLEDDGIGFDQEDEMFFRRICAP